MTHDVVADASEQRPTQEVKAAGSDDDQMRFLRFGCVDDTLARVVRLLSVNLVLYLEALLKLYIIIVYGILTSELKPLFRTQPSHALDYSYSSKQNVH